MRRAQQVHTKEDSRDARSATNDDNTHTTIKTTPSSFRFFPPLPGETIPRRGADDVPGDSPEATCPLKGDGDHFIDDSEAGSDAESWARSRLQEQTRAQPLGRDQNPVCLPTTETTGVNSVLARTLLPRNRFPPLPKSCSRTPANSPVSSPRHLSHFTARRPHSASCVRSGGDERPMTCFGSGYEGVHWNETRLRPDTEYDSFGRSAHGARGKDDKSSGDSQNYGDGIERRLFL